MAQGGGGFQGSLNGNAGLIMRLFNATGCTKWDYSFDNATNTGLARGGIQWFDQSEPSQDTKGKPLRGFPYVGFSFLIGACPCLLSWTLVRDEVSAVGHLEWYTFVNFFDVR